MVAINGSHPMIRWEMERGLDRTISSVAGESYAVDVSCGGDSFSMIYDIQVQCYFTGKVKKILKSKCFFCKG